MISQMRTTMDIYSHVMPALAREAADRMGAVLLGGDRQMDRTDAGDRGRTATNCNQRCNQRNQDDLVRVLALLKWVELRGLEPLTPTLPVWCATSCATAPICTRNRVPSTDGKDYTSPR